MRYMKSSTKYLKITINYITMIMLVLGCIYVLPRLIGFFAPFVVAWIIALIANPLVRFLESKLKIKRKAGSVVVVIVTLGIVVVACYWAVSLIVSEASGLMASLPEIAKRVSTALRSVGDNINRMFARLPLSISTQFDDFNETISDNLSGAMSNMGSVVAKSAGDYFKNIPLTLVGIVMGVLASYSFVAERDNVNDFVYKIMPQSVRDRYNIVINAMKTAVGGYFKAQFKIMGIVYVVLLVGMLILRVQYALLVALLIAILDFLPFFGTGTAMWPWAFIAFTQKDYKFAIGMMVTWGASQLVRQIIQPKLVGDSMGMPAIPTLFLMYIGFRLSGALGLIIAVPVGMVVYNLYKAGVFSNFIYSTRMLAKDIKRYREYTEEELLAEGIEMSVTGAGAHDDIDEAGNGDR